VANARDHLRSIQNFSGLVSYLETELDWPLQEYGFDELTFEYQPAELGLKVEDAVNIRGIHQLRPLHHGQPWGIFFVEFEKKKLPIVVLRRILSHLVVKKRASANKTKTAAWDSADLLFISAFGAEATDQREIAFAHFHQESGDLPTLRVLGWDGGDTPLKLDHVSATLKERLHWPDDPADRKAWREQWSRAFRHRIGHVIRTAEGLAETLAALARGIREAARTMMAHESESGPLTKLYKAFQTALIHDLTEESFADTYAQTITYGLLTAAISRTEMSEGRHGTALIAENVADMVPITNPFLKEMLHTFLKVGGRKGGIDFDELGIQDVVELLRGDETDLPAILRDFGNKNPNEDPVIHFYEHFLGAYDKPQKKQRGVFYTPQPVVSYIVRSVHELLQNEVGLEDGLASTITWGEMLKTHPGLKFPKIHVLRPGKPEGEDVDLSPDEFFVTMLDPATGTATFLVEVIDVIHRTLTAKWKQQALTDTQQHAAWNDYVPKYLLPRLYGYELLMAPYAIAHMKIGLKLYETGYRFASDERVRIYLTNSLEPAQDFSDRLAFDAPALAHEAKAVNDIKRYKRFTVVIGNPPYSALSANLSAENRRIVDRYRAVNGMPIRERSMLQFEKNIQDDYIKFVAIGQSHIENAGVGMLGYVTNHSYLDGPTLRGMRNNLLGTFSKLAFLDLHGNTNKKEHARQTDENVFDIQQGVAVTVLLRAASVGDRVCSTGHLWGTREEKYSFLTSHTLGSTTRKQFSPDDENFYFLAFESDYRGEYEQFLPLPKILLKNLTGTTTGFDALLMDFDRDVLIQRLERFSSRTSTDAALREEFGARAGHAAFVLTQRRSICRDDWKSFIKPFQLFPFDFRWAFLRKDLLQGHRFDVMENLRPNKPGLLATRQTKERFGVFSVTGFCGHKLLGSYDRSYVFPLYDLAVKGLTFLDQRQVRGKGAPEFSNNAPTEREVFDYLYAVLNSCGYRNRYAEFLKLDFPRLPLTGGLGLFRVLARFGGELVALHLLESPKVDNPITEFIGGRNPEIENISWSKNTVWVDKKQTTGFKGVREDVWNFHIGGYQVCEKWLKDRKGRALSKDDITHYHKIVVALSETIHIMKDVDEVIEKHGGWPAAFSAALSTASGSASVPIIADERETAITEYVKAEESLPLAAEAGLPFGGEHQPVTVDNGQDGGSSPSPRKTKTEASEETDFHSIDDIDQSEIMAAIRQVFNDGAARERETAMRDVARELGFDRTGSRIQERLNGELIAAARRGIVANKSGEISIAARTIEDYNRDYLKTLFLSDMGSTWWDRDDAINRATRYLGFTRTGARIYDSLKSVINGLIRDGRLESDPAKGIRRI
jgi:hypothetical protein